MNRSSIQIHSEQKTKELKDSASGNIYVVSSNPGISEFQEFYKVFCEANDYRKAMASVVYEQDKHFNKHNQDYSIDIIAQASETFFNEFIDFICSENEVFNACYIKTDENLPVENRFYMAYKENTMISAKHIAESICDFFKSYDHSIMVRSISSTIHLFVQSISKLTSKIDYNTTFERIRQSLLSVFESDPSLSKDEKKKHIEQILFESRWFMYKSNIAAEKFVNDVISILENRKITNKEKHIDQLVYKCVTSNIIKDVWRNWNARKLPSHIKRVLHEAIIGYNQKKYATTIIILISLQQGIISDLSNDASYRTSNKAKEQFASIVSDENDPEIISQFFNEYIMYDCYSVYDVKDNVPGRHGYAHGWLPKYPRRKAALNAILFTDYLISIYPRIDEDLLN
jgi:hypothetical protein